MLLLFIALGCRTAPSVEPVVFEHVELTRLADGVYAAIRRDEPLGLAQNANSLFVVTDDGVIVVDAQFTREATLENLRALRTITTRPVTHVVNTHWHDDHLAGNQVYQDSFPNVRFIAHADTREDLMQLGRPNRSGQVRFGPQALARFQRLLDMGLGIDSTPASPAEREAFRNSIRIFRQYVVENPGFREVLPNSIVNRSSVISAGSRRIELHWFGRGATRGDLVVWLPKERVLATGDLVVWPVPFAFGSHPAEWVQVLDSLAALGPAVLVPGHGPLIRDLAYLETERRMLLAATERAAAAVARGDTSAVALARSERMDDVRAQVAGTDKWKNLMFDQFFRVGALTAAFNDAMSSRTGSSARKSPPLSFSGSSASPERRCTPATTFSTVTRGASASTCIANSHFPRSGPLRVRRYFAVYTASRCSADSLRSSGLFSEPPSAAVGRRTACSFTATTATPDS